MQPNLLQSLQSSIRNVNQILAFRVLTIAYPRINYHGLYASWYNVYAVACLRCNKKSNKEAKNKCVFVYAVACLHCNLRPHRVAIANVNQVFSFARINHLELYAS